MAQVTVSDVGHQVLCAPRTWLFFLRGQRSCPPDGAAISDHPCLQDSLLALPIDPPVQIGQTLYARPYRSVRSCGLCSPSARQVPLLDLRDPSISDHLPGSALSGTFPMRHQQPLLAASRNNDAYHSATLHSVALWCIAFGRSPFWMGSARHLHHASRGHLAICAATNRSALGTNLSLMDQNQCRGPMSRPEFGRSHPTTAAAAPATSRLVHLQVIGREQMAIAADAGYSQGLEDAFQGKAHHISFGCSKARPRYQPNLGLHRRAPDCHVGPPSWQCPGSRYVNGLRTRTPVGAKWSTFRETTTRS